MSYCLQCGSTLGERVIDRLPRPHCTACGWTLWEDPKLAVAVIVTDGEHVLLGQRAQGERQGQWSLPAGFVDRGEVVEAAAARELMEEIGAAVEVGRLVDLVSEAGNSVVLAVYEAEMRAAQLGPTEEMSQLRWWRITELPPLAFEHDKAILERWARGSRLSTPPTDAAGGGAAPLPEV